MLLMKNAVAVNDIVLSEFKTNTTAAGGAFPQY